MKRRSGTWVALGVAASVCAATLPAQAEDFLSALFGGFGGGRPRAPSMPFANEGGPIGPQGEARARAGYSGGGVQSGHSAFLLIDWVPDQVKPSRPTPMP